VRDESGVAAAVARDQRLCSLRDALDEPGELVIRDSGGHETDFNGGVNRLAVTSVACSATTTRKQP
jgi:hypothetical protein